MSRDDLLKTNAGVVRSVCGEIKRVAPDAIVIVVTNPLDVMAQVALETLDFPRERVIGMAGVLDTARYRSFIALELDVSIEDIQALVLGGHGDTMVPLASYTSVSGIPLSQLMAQDRIDALVERTRKGGGEIVAYLKTGSAYYAPAAAAVQMAEAIVKDKRRILPCAAWLQGEYGMTDLYLGVPCMLGENGLERILEVDLADDERAALEKSAEHVRSTVAALQALE
jgi:malate dehydrogenase